MLDVCAVKYRAPLWRTVHVPRFNFSYKHLMGQNGSARDKENRRFNELQDYSSHVFILSEVSFIYTRRMNKTLSVQMNPCTFPSQPPPFVCSVYFIFNEYVNQKFSPNRLFSNGKLCHIFFTLSCHFVEKPPVSQSGNK